MKFKIAQINEEMKKEIINAINQSDDKGTAIYEAAEKIAADTGADLFEITPVTPYTSDDLNWTNSDSRVSREHDDESLRDVELTQITPDNWDSYDTVLIGYPIWWGIAAWTVDNFVKGNGWYRYMAGRTQIFFRSIGF